MSRISSRSALAVLAFYAAIWLACDRSSAVSRGSVEDGSVTTTEIQPGVQAVEFCGQTLTTTVSEVVCIDRSVKSLAPLRQLTVVKKLILHVGASRIDDIRGLSKLEVLEIPFAPVSDLSPVASIVTLRKLNVSGTNVKDLSPVAGLRSLEVLDISKTPVTDLEPLSNLASLVWLTASYTKISTLSPLSTTRSLERIAIVHTDIVDLSPLAELARFSELQAGNTKIVDLGPLRHIATLRKLDILETPVATIKALSGHEGLLQLRLGATRIRSLAGIELPALEILAVNEIRDLRPVQDFPRLTILDLTAMPSVDLSMLSGLRVLHELKLDGVRVEHLSALRKLASLKRIQLTGALVPRRAVDALRSARPDLEIYVIR